MAPKIATVSVAEFAADHGLTAMAVGDWIRKGMPCRSISGLRRLVRRDANKWLRESIRETARSDTPDEAAERARKLRAEADLKELELAERRGLLVPVATFESELEQIVGGFLAVAAGQLTRFEPEIVAAATVGAARKVTQAIHGALVQGSRDYAQRLETEAGEMGEEAVA